jgi:dihydrofolate reductase
MSIHLYAVTTLDGKIALHDHDQLTWSSPEDKQFLSQEMKRFPLAFVGRSTYDLSSSFFKQKTCVVFSRSVTSLTQRDEHLFYSPLEGFDPADFCQRIGVDQATVLGGSYIYSYFLQMGWVDHIHLTLEPLLFGHGVPWLSTREVNQNYRLSQVRQLNSSGTLLLEYDRFGDLVLATDST